MGWSWQALVWKYIDVYNLPRSLESTSDDAPEQEKIKSWQRNVHKKC